MGTDDVQGVTASTGAGQGAAASGAAERDFLTGTSLGQDAIPSCWLTCCHQLPA